jgi:hypothetical protein
VSTEECFSGWRNLVTEDRYPQMAPLKLPPFPLRLFLLAGFAIPAVSAIAFFQNHPLDARVTSQIQSLSTPSSSCSSSCFVRQVINEENRPSILANSLFIRIPRSRLRNLSDEEILARLTKGVFEGTIFYPEKALLFILGMLGVRRFRADFSSMQHVENKHHDRLLILSEFPNPGQRIHEIPRDSLLPLKSLLFQDTFIVLDSRSTPVPASLPSGQGQFPSYIDIGFGSDRRSFAGFHRLEVSHEQPAKEGGEYARISLSTITCNPINNVPGFPRMFQSFHTWYAEQLFRDGVREVLAD